MMVEASVPQNVHKINLVPLVELFRHIRASLIVRDRFFFASLYATVSPDLNVAFRALNSEQTSPLLAMDSDWPVS